MRQPDFPQSVALACAALWFVFVAIAVIFRVTRWAWEQHRRFFK